LINIILILPVVLFIPVYHIIILSIIFEAIIAAMKVTLNLLFFFLFLMVKANAQNGIDKPAFYKTLASGNTAAIDNQLSMLQQSAIPEKNAYEGTLLMKKAQLVSNPKEKLSLFKSGRTKLESSISFNKENTEYRFLRLIIQEHAPKIVRYRKNLEEDSQVIRSNFKTLSLELQQVITDYSKKSGILKIGQP
jgi:hypothetical protein